MATRSEALSQGPNWRALALLVGVCLLLLAFVLMASSLGAEKNFGDIAEQELANALDAEAEAAAALEAGDAEKAAEKIEEALAALQGFRSASEVSSAQGATLPDLAEPDLAEPDLAGSAEALENLLAADLEALKTLSLETYQKLNNEWWEFLLSLK